ncbi:uncharacterized protein BROUX77_006057 [Berkeleyomyces rouxiae]|uniref:uncharacterized protein n=1 Tax=Berkeleyomyces rouxiae TaxID=2035830 RepID=UPI003B7F260D
MSLNDMDWDVEEAGHEAQAPVVADIDNALDEVLENTTKEPLTLASNKVHIRGLDVLTTADIKEYVREHYGSLERVEWIDDTSANLIFPSDTSASDALNALSATPIDHALAPTPDHLYPAKPFARQPETSLAVRCAFTRDKKENGAAARSRFYLLNPEYDPEERMRYERERERERRHADHRTLRDRQRARLRRADDDKDVEKFSNDFYDDDSQGDDDRARARRRRERSYSRSPARRNGSRELFPDRLGRGTTRRDRSASPARHTATMDLDADADTASLGPAARPGRNKERDQFIRDQQRLKNRGKNLFPELEPRKPRATGSHMDMLDESVETKARAAQGFAIKGAATTKAKELFPSRFTSNAGKELFAEKLHGRGKLRPKAEDSW